jgi:glycerol kinase
MEKDIGIKFNEVKVDGGMVNNNLLMQFQSDIFNKNIISRDIQEITAYGAGIASYISFNAIEVEDFDIDIKKSNSWSPNLNETLRSEYISLWNKAIEKSKNWL